MASRTRPDFTRTSVRFALFCAVLAVFANCAPDPDPPLGVNAPTNNNTDTPDMDVPDTATDPDMTRPSDRDLGSDQGGRPDMESDSGISDTGGAACEGVECGNGTCIELLGGTECSCDAGFTGEQCDSCDPGYMGAACDECAIGFMPDPLGSTTCVPDPCDPDPCSGNGACITSTDPTGSQAAVCRCDTGFVGDACDTCDTGYEGADCDVCSAGFTLDNGECVILACSPFPCLNGLCLDADGDGTAECNCDAGWTGRDCGTCAVGFILDATTGQCVPDVCLNVPCDNGTCSPNPTGGAAFCLCETGYQGAACDSCDYGYTAVTVGTQTQCLNELPVRDSRITGWFDAAKASTFDLVGGDGVHNWRNRVQPYAMKEPGADANRPRYVLLPQPGVEFDGNDALWASHSLVGITDAYSIFVVVSWGAATSGDVIVDSFYPNSFELPYRIMVWDDTARFSHGDGVAIPESLLHNGFDQAAGPQLVIAQRQPFLNGRVMALGNGTTESTMPSTKPDFTAETLSMLGAANDPGGWGTRGLDGRLHEVIYVRGALTLNERKAIAAYLEVKWGL